jgi:1-aminocyclopropane-1-carboxylate deaminase
VEEHHQPVDLSKAILHPLPDERLLAKQIEAVVLRLDRIHPVVSGNKWFKLKYHLQEALAQGYGGVATFGGAWSNHLVATAFACRQAGLQSMGIVRGETRSKALEDAMRYGMELQFVSRSEYGTRQVPGNYYKVPVGGASDHGIAGAQEILQLIDPSAYSHVACAVGTGTMLAGLMKGPLPVIGISSLKIPPASTNVFYDYHFGGYARWNSTLIEFMNEIYQLHGLPTDFVYTAKLLYGVMDLASKDYFAPGSRLLIIHSGGLQGNRGLPAGQLTFL